MPKFLCLCEEVTLEEVERVIKEENIRDLETLKRRLRIGMGHCGGRYCINMLLKLYPKLFGSSPRYKSAEEIPVPSSRPPVKPTSLVKIVGGKE